MAAQHELSKMVRSHNGRLYHRPHVIDSLLTTEEANYVPWSRAAFTYVLDAKPPKWPAETLAMGFPETLCLSAKNSKIYTIWLHHIEHDQAAEEFAVLNIKNPSALGVELPKELVQMIYLMAIHD